MRGGAAVWNSNSLNLDSTSRAKIFLQNISCKYHQNNHNQLIFLLLRLKVQRIKIESIAQCFLEIQRMWQIASKISPTSLSQVKNCVHDLIATPFPSCSAGSSFFSQDCKKNFSESSRLLFAFISTWKPSSLTMSLSYSFSNIVCKSLLGCSNLEGNHSNQICCDVWVLLASIWIIYITLFLAHLCIRCCKARRTDNSSLLWVST